MFSEIKDAATVAQERQDEKEKMARDRRNRLLADTDWTQVDDSPLKSDPDVIAYRQALRNLPSMDGFPDVDFPTPPPALEL